MPDPTPTTTPADLAPGWPLMIRRPWEFLGCSRSAWYRHEPKPKPVRFDGSRLYCRSDLERLVERLRPAR